MAEDRVLKPEDRLPSSSSLKLQDRHFSVTTPGKPQVLFFKLQVITSLLRSSAFGDSDDDFEADFREFKDKSDIDEVDVDDDLLCDFRTLGFSAAKPRKPSRSLSCGSGAVESVKFIGNANKSEKRKRKNLYRGIRQRQGELS